ncbi:NAD-dependent epimerase/dehydratase family protein [Nitrospira defluvii]|nr:NAD-dependent epimerase/dehydratase family protein [Nitrospira defluvii]
MKVMVTGGAGFIGSHLVGRLIEEGHEVVVVDDLSTGKKKNLHKDAIFYKLDITSSRLKRLFKNERPEVILHHAAQMDVRKSVADPAFDAKSNILGLLNLLGCALENGTRRMIFASSGGAVYGEQETFPATEDHPTHPLSPYGVSKLSSEHYLYYYQKVFGLEYTALRYGNVYGPRQDPHGEAGVVAIFTKMMLKGEHPIINGNGKQTRDYVYVDDVVEANMAVFNKKINGIFNIGTGRETTVNQLFQTLLKITVSDAKETHGPEKKGEQMRSCLDCEKISEAAEWEPLVSLKEGLENTVAYFRDH